MARTSDTTRITGAGAAGRLSRVRDALASPADSASLAVFRIGFGAIIAWEVWRAFDTNLIRADYDTPTYLFRWWLFEWVRPLPGPLIYVAFAALGIGAVLLALGLFTRVAAAITCAGMTYWFLMDKASYLNHRYLAALLAFLLILAPAGAEWSLDAGRKARVGTSAVAAPIPAWPIWLLRFQMACPYFFGGIAKLNFDWLVRAQPLQAALAAQSDFPLIGQYLANSVVAHVLAWGATALDLSVPFLLLHRRTRSFAFAAALTFHFINSRLFDIGMFPWLMVVGSTIFFEAGWPRRMLAMVRSDDRRHRRTLVIAFAAGFVVGGFLPETFVLMRAVVAGFGVAVLVFLFMTDKPFAGRAQATDDPVPTDARAATPKRFTLTRPLLAFLAVWVAVQSIAPLVHFAIPGNEYWTEEGNRFAWHMLVRVKEVRVVFILTDARTGKSWIENPLKHLTRYQVKKMDTPDMILQFAHRLEDVYRAHGVRDLEVRVQAKASLNGRRPQRYIKKTVDLTTIPRPYLFPADWISPMRPYASADD